MNRVPIGELPEFIRDVEITCDDDLRTSQRRDGAQEDESQARDKPQFCADHSSCPSCECVRHCVPAPTKRMTVPPAPTAHAAVDESTSILRSAGNPAP